MMTNGTTFGKCDIQCVASVAAIVTCVLSMGGCSVIFATWLLLKRVRTASRLMLLNLTVADFAVAIGQLAGASWSLQRQLCTQDDPSNCTCHERSDIECTAQSFVSTMATMSSFLWSMLIAWHAHRTVVVPGTTDLSWIERHQWAQHVLCWLGPMVIVVVALSRDRLGLDSVMGHDNHHVTVASATWCWIKTCPGEMPGPKEVEIITFYLITGQFWLYLAFLVIPLLYIRTKRRIRASTILSPDTPCKTSDMYETVREADRLLTWVPVTFLLLRMWSVLRFVGNMIMVYEKPSDHDAFGIIFNRVFLVIQAVGDSGQGFVNCILYCILTDSVRIELKKALRRCTRCRRGEEIRGKTPARVDGKIVRTSIASVNYASSTYDDEGTGSATSSSNDENSERKLLLHAHTGRDGPRVAQPGSYSSLDPRGESGVSA